MTIEEIKAVLYEAAKLRMPRFSKDDNWTSRGKIEALEDYLMATARWRGFLEEARLHAEYGVKELRSEWDHLTGWEALRRNGERTQASVEDAKRQMRPELYDSIKSGEWLVKRLSEQIRRLEHDDDVASRVYTLITGT